MLVKNTPPTTARQAGFTLVELLVAIAAGLVVVGAGISMLTSTFSSNTSALRMTRMNQDLRGMMNAVSYDLTRAGHWGLATRIPEISASTDLVFSTTTAGSATVSAFARGTTTSVAAFAAPITTGTTASNLYNLPLVLVISNAATPAVTTRYDLTITGVNDDHTLAVTIPTLPRTKVGAGNWTILNPFRTITLNPAGTCVLFSYDLNDNGKVDNDSVTREQFGYRLDATGTSLQTTNSSTDCGDTSGAWKAASDDNMLTITRFLVTQTTPSVLPTDPTYFTTVRLMQTQVRQYSVSLAGQLNSDATAQRSFRNVVEVRNHLVK